MMIRGGVIVDKKLIIKGLKGWVLAAGVAFVLVMLLNTKVFALPQVEQDSMQNTLFEGQRLFLDKLSYNFHEPRKGDVIVFLENKVESGFFSGFKIYLTDMADVFKDEKINDRLVKRVIGVPGDVINIKNSCVYVNGEKLEEEYAKGGTFTREIAFPVKVPKGKLFVLGDNREVSRDSREFGFIEFKNVEGKVRLKVWPFKEAGKVR